MLMVCRMGLRRMLQKVSCYSYEKSTTRYYNEEIINVRRLFLFSSSSF